MYIEKRYPFLNSLFWAVLIISKTPHDDNECYQLKKQEVLSKASLCFILMVVYPRSSDLSDHEFLLENLKFIFGLIQYNSSRVLNEALSRQYFPCKMKQCKNYLILMLPCYYYKQNRNVNTMTIKSMTMMMLMMIIIIAIIIAIMIIKRKMILKIAVVIIINSPFKPGDFSTGYTTVHWMRWNRRKEMKLIYIILYYKRLIVLYYLLHLSYKCEGIIHT